MPSQFSTHDFPVRYNINPEVKSGKAPQTFISLLLDRVTDGKGINGFLRRYRSELVTWITFFCASIVLALFFSDLSFSGILTLASGFQLLSYVLISIKIYTTQTVASLSSETLILTAIALMARLVSTCQFNGYLPMDRSGDWLLQSIDAISLALVGISLYSIFYVYNNTKNTESDILKFWMMIPFCLILSPILRANLNHHYFADNCWMFSLLVETCANLPQIVVISNQSTEVEGFTGHFLAAQAVSKMFSTLFWATSYKELIVAGSTQLSSLAICCCYCLQTLILADFFYYYIRAVGTNTRLVVSDLDLI